MKGNQRVALTKRLLQEALIRLLEKKPLDKINVTELCNESGINRATFYRHYQVPRDVLLDMEAELSETLNTSYNIMNRRDIPSYIEELLTYLYSQSALIKVFLKNNSADDFMLLMNKMFDNFIKGKDNFTRLAGVDEDSLKLITTFITGGGCSMLHQWLVGDIQKSPKEIADLILKFLNYTVTVLTQGQTAEKAP